MWPSDLTMAMTLTLNFQGQIWNLLYHWKMVWMAMKLKSNILIELKTSNVTIVFDLGHDLESWGVRIYLKVTRVTSDVTVLSTHLVQSLEHIPWNLNQNATICIQENVVCKLLAILFWPYCVWFYVEHCAESVRETGYSSIMIRWGLVTYFLGCLWEYFAEFVWKTWSWNMAGIYSEITRCGKVTKAGYQYQQFDV